MSLDIRRVMAGQVQYQPPVDRSLLRAAHGLSGRAYREFSQGWSHAKQGRLDLLGQSSFYDQGFAALANLQKAAR